MSAELRARHCLTLEASVGAPIESGDSGRGRRRCIPLLGGRFTGDLQGELIPGGLDWQTVLSDGSVELSAHYALRTDDGAVIEVTSVGVRHAAPDVLSRIERGESVSVDEYYFRTQMRWHTGAPHLARWNHVLLVARGERLARVVRLDVFEIE